MKTSNKSKLISGLFLFLLTGFVSCDKITNEEQNSEYSKLLNVDSEGISLVIQTNLKAALSDDTTFNDDELNILLQIKEEEKLARDVYTHLYELWGTRIFSNISAAENNHMNAVISLLTTYGDEYTKTADPGQFENQDFKILYDQLVNQGTSSLEEAYKIGALIEEMDINDIIGTTAKVTNENIIIVFENLLKGSRNHLRAFNKQLTNLGVTYSPVYITQSDYDSIINSSIESGMKYHMHGNKKNKRNCQL